MCAPESRDDAVQRSMAGLCQISGQPLHRDHAVAVIVGKIEPVVDVLEPLEAKPLLELGAVRLDRSLHVALRHLSLMP